FLLCILGVATGFAIQGTSQVDPKATGGGFYAIPFIYLVMIVLLGIGIVALDIIIKNKQITTISAIYFGLLLGLLFGHLFSSAIFPLVETDASRWLNTPLRILITLFFCYICVSTLYQTKDDFRFIIPYVEFSKQIKGSRALVLDTSVIIDGRIADISDTKIIDTRLIVPRFVLQELQNVADSTDKLKRNRGRRGMDMLKRM
ncbi:MAG: PIN/TRAM domain-containing protein, partial [Anaerolineales bacterium]|nr:PIN/TRAM domain-containing protein [Anaerolineales bacterium]